MSTNYPTSIDDGTTLPNPTGANTLNSPDHAAEHANVNDAVKAVETKLGTGASTAASGQVLRGTGSGASAFGQLVLSTDVATFSSGDLHGALSDETGTGLAVFGTTPTLSTPKVDTINESTPGNGTTIGGVNIKSGALNTNNSVVTANITNAAVTPDKLGTGAGRAVILTSETTTSSSFTDLATPGPAVTVTIGANGLALVILACQCSNGTISDYAVMGFAASGANTIAASLQRALVNKAAAAADDKAMSWSYLATGLSSGSTTFTAKYEIVTGGTATFVNRYISVIPL